MGCGLSILQCFLWSQVLIPKLTLHCHCVIQKHFASLVSVLLITIAEPNEFHSERGTVNLSLGTIKRGGVTVPDCIVRRKQFDKDLSGKSRGVPHSDSKTSRSIRISMQRRLLGLYVC